MEQKTVLIFGGGALQKSIIQKVNGLGHVSVVIDPDSNAVEQYNCMHFEVVQGHDFEKTCNVIEHYKVDAIVTAATDKPLLMMARVAEKYNLPYFSTQTAIISTDKWQMKKIFAENSIRHAKGIEIDELSLERITEFPVIIKPKDNSGSRGVYFCKNGKDIERFIGKSLEHSKVKQIIAEEFIPGQEYSVEALHSDNSTIVIQITQKITTDFPYNVELGHFCPAELDEEIIHKVEECICKVAKAFNFRNCASHTEFKIIDKEVCIIETSPRLGGDYITSHLVPFSSQIDIEKELIFLALGSSLSKDLSKEPKKGFAQITYINFEGKRLLNVIDETYFIEKYELVDFSMNLRVGEVAPKITNSLDRYGYFILSTSKEKIDIINLQIINELNTYFE